MPLNRISKDSEASNAPESLKTTRTLKLHADNAILKFKKQINKQTKKTTSGFGELKKKKKKGDDRKKPDTGCQREISTVSS